METPLFTKLIKELLSDDHYADLQNHIRLDPKVGDIIPGSGGLRKVRWMTHGRGKRGGIRVIYYWYVPDDRVYMMLAYAKNQQDNLSPSQLKLLKRLIEEEFKNG